MYVCVCVYTTDREQRGCLLLVCVPITAYECVCVFVTIVVRLNMIVGAFVYVCVY